MKMEDNNMDEFIEKIKSMRTSDLINWYSDVTDEQSIEYMNEFWTRFPFDVWDDWQNDILVKLNKQENRIKDLEKTIELQNRVLDRIDRLTKAVSGRQK